jgi:hypothetical protein
MCAVMSRDAAAYWWKIQVPKEVHHYRKGVFSRDWEIITWRDIFKERTEKQNNRIRIKRFHSVVKPGYVWVFYNDNWLMGGWYIYVRTLKKSWAINFRNNNAQKQVDLIMNLFPCGVLPIKENFEIWCVSFSKLFPFQGFGGRKRQGLIKCYVEFRGDDIINVSSIN